MNETILKAVNPDIFDEYGYTIFQAICSLNEVMRLPQLKDEKVSLKRMRSTITMLDRLMQKYNESDK